MCEFFICLASVSIISNQADFLLYALRHLPLRKREHCSSGWFAGFGSHNATAIQIQSFRKAQTHEFLHVAAWNDDRKLTIGIKERGNLLDKLRKWQTPAVTGQSATRIVGQCVLGKERRIAEYGIKTIFRAKRRNVLQGTTYAVSKRTFRNILLCLKNCRFVDIDAKNLSIRIPLCCHQGNNARACTDIQDTLPLNTTPCTQQYAVCTNLHGTSVVTNTKTLKTKIRVAHFGD